MAMLCLWLSADSWFLASIKQPLVLWHSQATCILLQWSTPLRTATTTMTMFCSARNVISLQFCQCSPRMQDGATPQFMVDRYCEELPLGKHAGRMEESLTTFRVTNEASKSRLHLPRLNALKSLLSPHLA